ncbi:putative bnr asp-box repeat domain protein [Diplodia seriata]|uniref:Putative bnr asp-box repeat domain protein n=1 Tax=Diplodia seriata TaxID=420778 RepID=A0A0G2GK12_9PEZI|nr:putative bnr asp-box repeat domain protein [Diplodia seriata]
MRFSLALGAAALSHLAQALDHVTIFTPPSDYIVPRTLYARTLYLEQEDALLATWENYSPEPPLVWYPIYRSDDQGESWYELSKVNDTVNNWGNRYQPFLYELKAAYGDYEAGTLLLAGNALPTDLNFTKIDIYASKDRGVTWEFVSSVANGGRGLPNNGETPVWEPFIMEYNSQIITYYSDQRDPAHGQKMVHQVSTDLVSWGDVVDDVAYDTYDWRPGMPTIALLPNGQYLLTYEFYGAEEADFAVYYRLSEDPLLFDSAPGQVIRTQNGTVPVGSPYVVWTPAGGENGTIVVSCGTDSQVFINRALGDADAWYDLNTVETTSYTRSLLVWGTEGEILIAGGGVLNGANNSVTASTVNVAA